MASGVARNVSGSYVGTGAEQEIRADKVGFQPRRLTIERADTEFTKSEHLEGMDAGSRFKTAANGTRTLESTGGPTLLYDGFSVPDSDDVNALGSVYRYFAEE